MTDENLEKLREHFEEGKTGLIFVLESAREQAKRASLLGNIYKVYQDYDELDKDNQLAQLEEVANIVLKTYDEMIKRAKKLEVEDFMKDADSVQDPFSSMLPYWTERDYKTMDELIKDMFIYDTISPIGSKLSQLWTAVQEDMHTLEEIEKNDKGVEELDEKEMS